MQIINSLETKPYNERLMYLGIFTLQKDYFREQMMTSFTYLKRYTENILQKYPESKDQYSSEVTRSLYSTKLAKFTEKSIGQALLINIKQIMSREWP